ncbi:hypothetical protein [Bradyrhizobium cenepequi]
MTPEETIASAGYKLVTWAEFQTANDVPPFVRQVAERLHKRWGGEFVVYDPAGGDRGWLLVDDDRDQIIGETVEHLDRLESQSAGASSQPEQPAQGSLF